VWGGVVARVLAWAEGQGLPPGTLRAAEGLSPGALASPTARVPLGTFYALLEALAARLEEPCTGLRVVAALRAEDLDALGFLGVSSATLGSALEAGLRYQRLWSDGERLEREARGEAVHVRFHPHGPARPAHHLAAQVVLGDVVLNAGALVGGLPGACVRFRGPPAGPPARYLALLGLPVRFGAAEDAVELPARLLERPLPGANAGLSRVLTRTADALLAQLPDGARLASRVRALLPEVLPEGEGVLARVAARLRLPPRTLQRRLREEGTSLEAEREAFRRERALALLAGGERIAEVAWRLGYSVPSAFHHAFRRWTGLSPEAWRRQQEGGG
jgi:AraC-like DNA-binding protein